MRTVEVKQSLNSAIRSPKPALDAGRDWRSVIRIAKCATLAVLAVSLAQKLCHKDSSVCLRFLMKSSKPVVF
jgi:hypothetical protein